jgi:tetratricopeptide (TPR) repeat protein
VESSGAGTVIEPLLTLERGEATGVLEMTALGVTTRIYFRTGEIVFAEGGTLGETLGRMLIRCGRLGEEHVAAVIRRMTDAVVDGHHVRFGEIVVENGFMTADELELALMQQVKEKIIGCIHRGSGEWKFTKDDPRLDAVGSYVVRTRPLLVEAAAQFPERRLETVLRLDENRYPEIIAPAGAIAEEFELSTDEAAVLRELDGTASVHFILSKSGPVDIAPIVVALVLGGGVELRTTPTGSRQSSTSRAVPPDFRTSRRAREEHTEVTVRAPVASLPSSTRTKREPTHSSPTLAVAQAVALPRRSTRENLRPADAEAQERARKAFDRLKGELDSRKAGKRKRWPEPRNDKERLLMAESAFHQGRLHLRAEDAERALPGLHRALELCPEEREYELYVKWAQMLVNDWFKDDARRRELQSLAATVVRANRDCELGLSILGHCAMHDGKEEAALRFFQRASQLDPKLVDAARLTPLLAMRASNRPRRTASKMDLDARRSARGKLETPIDELVPVLSLPPEAAPKSRRDAKAKAGRSTGTGFGMPTPQGGLIAEPAFGSTPDETWEGAPAPPPGSDPRADVTEAACKAPPPPTPHAHEPAPPFGTEAILQAPLDPPVQAAPDPKDGPTAPAVTAPLSPWRIPPAQPVDPGGFGTGIPPAPPAFAMAMGRTEDLPFGRPQRGRIVAIAGAWVASLAATAAIFYFLGSREAPSSEETTVSTVLTSDTMSEGPPQAPAEAPPTEVTAPPASSSVASVPSPAKSGKPPTTGVLKTKAWGRRVYVDGHIVGEGGRALTVPCGTRRVKVGSTGTTRTVSIPCGGTLQLD